MGDLGVGMIGQGPVTGSLSALRRLGRRSRVAAFVLRHADLGISFANAEYCALTGGETRKAPFLDEHLPRGRHREEARAALDDLVTAARRGCFAEAEIPAEIAGERRTLRVSVAALDREGRASLWELADITMARTAAPLLRPEDAARLDWLGMQGIALVRMDHDGRVVYADDILGDWLGKAPGEIADRRPIGDVLGTGAADVAGRIGQGETRRITVRGGAGSVPLEMAVIPAREGRDRFLVLRDLRGREELAERLNEAQTRSAAFFNDSPVGIAVIDTEGTVVEANPAFHFVTGLDLGAALGRRFSDLIAEENRAEVVLRIASALGDESVMSPVEVRFEGGGQRVAHLYATHMAEHGGRGGGAVVHLVDFTEHKNLELQFTQSQKMQAVGQLAGGMAHDFNNLLTAIIGFSDLLLVRHHAGDQSFADVMQIKQNANRAANLVRQLLAFSRRQTLRPRLLDVTDVIAELSHLLRRLLGEHIELEVSYGRDLGIVKVDQGQLEQVIINLAINARDAMADGGRLSIRTANVGPDDPRLKGHPIPRDEYVMIEVSDTGHGIPKDILDKIFDPFFTTKEVGQGTGLGLSMVYGIIQQTGGYIVPESAEGEGATFRIFLPPHGEADEIAAIRTGQPAEKMSHDLTGSATILLVEDETAVRAFAARALRNKGYNVLEAASGEAALEHVLNRDERLDMMISDVVMPKMDGPTLVKKAREERPGIKVVLISGYAEETFRKTLDPKDFSFLPKPFSLKELASTVKEVLEG